MKAYKDPTADIAIRNVDFERSYTPPRTHGGTARYHKPKSNGGGKHIRINKAEWFYSKFRKALQADEHSLRTHTELLPQDYTINQIADRTQPES